MLRSRLVRAHSIPVQTDSAMVESFEVYGHMQEALDGQVIDHMSFEIAIGPTVVPLDQVHLQFERGCIGTLSPGAIQGGAQGICEKKPRFVPPSDQNGNEESTS